MGLTVNQIKAQQKFFDEFSQKVGDKVVDVDMAELRAEKFVYDEMGMTPQPSQKSIWGLAVFCEHGFYFYVSPSENFFTAMFRVAAHSEPPKEQMLAVHEIPNLKVALPKNNFFSRFSYEHSRRVDFSFSAQNGGEYPFSLIFNKKAEAVFDRICEFSVGKTAARQNVAPK